MIFYTKTSATLFLVLLNVNLTLAQTGPFWSEDFSAATGSELPTGWSSEDFSENIDTLGNPIEVLWQRCEGLDLCAPSSLATPLSIDFASTSAANGYVFADSSSYGFIPEDLLLSPNMSALNSPPIILPPEGDQLFLEFQSFLTTYHIREHEGTRLYIQPDGGEWEEKIIYPETPSAPDWAPQRTHNANVFFIDLSEYAAAESIRLRWVWQNANEAVWCLDDIKLFDYNPLEVRSVWYSGEFAGGLNDWTIQTSGSVDTCEWYWDPIGYYGNGLFPFATNELPAGNDNLFINSPTALNGAMVVSGDYCMTNGLPGQPPSLYSFTSELISPTIDLSEVNRPPVLDFYQAVRVFIFGNQDPYPFLTHWRYSIDDGSTWSAPLALNENLAQNITYHNHISVLMPEEVVGEPEVRIKFVYAGTLFYWLIDDVRILERADYDLRISEDFFAVAPNFSVPSSQIDSIPFLADIENFGKTEQTDVWLISKIYNKDSEELLYADSVFIPEIAPLELIENIEFPTAFFPPPEAAEYRGEYTVRGNPEEETPEDNVRNYFFKVTDNTFAKEERSSFGFSPDARTYAWGNVFYVPNGAGFRAKNIGFSIENVIEMTDEIIALEIYEWQDSFGDTTLTASPAEYEEIFSTFYQVSGLEEGITEVPVINDGEKVLLKDDTHYIVALKYENGAPNAPDCFLSTSQEINYEATFFNSFLREELRYVTAVDDDLDGTFELIGLGNNGGFNFIPQIRLSIADTTTNIAAIPEEHDFILSPNPAKDIIYLTSEKEVKGQIIITNQYGRLVEGMEVYKTGASIPVSNLPRGVYYVRFTPENRRFYIVKKFVKL